jgi:hypothetical protein
VSGPEPKLPPERRRLALRSAGIAAALLVALLAATQLLLPRIAASRLRGSLLRYGSGVSVSVSAFPALELLLGEADSVDVHIDRLRSSSEHVGLLLARTEAVGTLTARVDRLDTDGLALEDVALRKRGDALSATATVSRGAVRAILPIDLSLAPDPPGANGLVVTGRLGVLGRGVAVSARVAAERGAIVLRPDLGGFGSLLDAIDVRLFSDPAIAVDRVWARAAATGYRLGAVSHYR